jgi:hypothetical protein
MGKNLEQLGDDEILKNGPAHWTGSGMFDIPQPNQVAEQASIGEVHLWGFYKAFAYVGEVRSQDEYLETGLQDRNSIPSCID